MIVGRGVPQRLRGELRPRAAAQRVRPATAEPGEWFQTRRPLLFVRAACEAVRAAVKHPRGLPEEPAEHFLCVDDLRFAKSRSVR